mmetsp:Transcript_28306/g.39976  ORF Transcript_28306/g.39976 Transcript_28306/m.39976 type:complete len:120 (-) Transcript_28306:317-676(-)
MPVDAGLVMLDHAAMWDPLSPSFMDIPTLEVECDMNIGKELYTFFYPIDVGNFVIQLWTLAPQLEFCVKIFEHGQQISSRDPRFKSFPWAQKLFSAWKIQTFNRREIDAIVMDLNKLSH